MKDTKILALCDDAQLTKNIVEQLNSFKYNTIEYTHNYNECLEQIPTFLPEILLFCLTSHTKSDQAKLFARRINFEYNLPIIYLINSKEINKFSELLYQDPLTILSIPFIKQQFDIAVETSLTKKIILEKYNWNEYIQRLLISNPESILIITSEQKIQYISGNIQTQLGIKISDILYGSVYNLFNFFDFTCQVNSSNLCFEGTNIGIMANDGELKPYNYSSYPIKFHNIDSELIILTEIKQEGSAANNLLQTSSNTMCEIAPIPVRIINKSGIIQYVNSAFCTLVSMNKEQLTGKHYSVIYYKDNSSDYSQTDLNIQDQQNIDIVIEKQFILWNKDKKWLEITNSKFEISNDNFKILSIFRDVTQIKGSNLVLSNKIKYENLLSNITTHFIRSDNESKQDCIANSLELIGNHLYADRVSIYILSDSNTNTFFLNSEWINKSTSIENKSVNKIYIDDTTIKNLVSKSFLHIRDVNSTSEQIKKIYSFVISNELKTFILLPYLQHNSLNGFLLIESFTNIKDWKETDLSQLLNINEIINIYIQKMDISIELDNQKDIFTKIIDKMSQGIILTNSSNLVIYCNQTFLTLSQLSKEDILFKLTDEEIFRKLRAEYEAVYNNTKQLHLNALKEIPSESRFISNFSIKRKDNTQIIANGSISRMQLADKDFIGYLYIFNFQS